MNADAQFHSVSVQLVCVDCHHQVDIDTENTPKIIDEYDTSDYISVEEFLRGNVGRLKCSKCGSSRIEISRLCENCQQPIPDERLEYLPEARYCVKCQESKETTEPMVKDTDFGTCPRCGKKLKQRLNRKTSPVSYFIGCSGYPKCHYTEN